MSQKTIALQLRTLAADTDSQALLLKEASCLSGLVALLHADNEEEVLILSLQALQFLAVPTAHHSTLVNQPGLILALTLLTDKPSIAIKTLAQNVLGSLESYINGQSTSPSTSLPSSVATSSSSSSSSAAVSRRTTPGHSRAGSRGNTRPTTPREGGASTGTSAFAPRYLNHVLFHISTANNTSLDKASQGEVEKVLVGIKGVISVAVTNARDKTASAFTLYTSLRPPMLQPLVNKALEGVRGGAFTAVFVDKNGNKSGAVSQKDDTDKENQENNAPAQPQAKKPGYLSKSVLGKSAAGGATTTSTSSSSSAPGYLNASTLNSTHSRAMQTHQTATSASDSAQGLAARYMGAKKKAAAAAAAEPAPAPARKGILSSVTSYFW